MPNFVVTTVGAAAAAAASPSGPRITLTEFRLGSNFSTPAAESNTALAGTTVYTGIPSHFSLFDAQTVQVILEIPASAGPFSYGEIGIYLSTGILFARFSYGELKTKTSTAVTGYAQIRRIHALLRIEQNPAVFNFYTGTPPLITEYPNFSFVVAPSVIATTPVVLVHEPTPYNDSILIHSHTDNLWTIDDYPYVGSATVTASTENSITATFFGTLGDTATSGKFLVQTPTGQIRSVTSISGNVATFATDFAPVPAPASVLLVYEAVESVASRVTALRADLNQLRSDFDTQLLAKALDDVGKVHYRLNPLPVSPVELPADGQAIDRVFYAALFNKIGTFYGAGNGTTTFNIPDLRGRFIRAWDRGANIDPGRVLGSFQADELRSHRHVYHSGYGSGPVGTPTEQEGDGNLEIYSPVTDYTGGSETRPTNIALYATIVVRTGYEIGVPPPPEVALIVSPSSVSLTYVAGNPVVNQVVATYGPPGDATVTLASGAMPAGLTLTDDGVSSLRINGTPTAIASTSAVFTVTQGAYVGSFTYNASVVASLPPIPPSAVVSITNRTVSATMATLGSSVINYTLQNDGALLLFRPNQTDVDPYEYPAAEWFTSGSISNVEARVTLVSGDALSGTSAPTGVWLNMGTTRSWGLQTIRAITGAKSCVIFVELRDSITTTVLDVATVTISLTV